MILNLFLFSSNENLRPKNEDAKEWAQGMSRLLASPCKNKNVVVAVVIVVADVVVVNSDVFNHQHIRKLICYCKEWETVGFRHP